MMYEDKYDESIEHIDVDGNSSLLEDQSLETLQHVVGGYIEILRTNDDRFMACNEEGLLLGLPVNKVASELAGRMIVGDVVVMYHMD